MKRAPEKGKGQARSRRHGRSGEAAHGNPGAMTKRQERERKRRAQLLTRLKRVALVVVAAIAVVVLVSAVRNATVFRISAVEVTGTTQLDESAVREAAAIPDDATIFTVAESDVRNRLITDPWIADVELSRKVPSTLVIEIVERTPAVIVDTGAEFWWVDAEGMVLGTASLETTAATVMVRGVPDFQPTPGQVTSAPALLNALKVVQGVSPELKSRIRSISAPSALETAVITDGGVEVMLGEATLLQEKSALALSILAEEGERVVFIDVRSTERPISRGLGDD